MRTPWRADEAMKRPIGLRSEASGVSAMTVALCMVSKLCETPRAVSKTSARTRQASTHFGVRLFAKAPRIVFGNQTLERDRRVAARQGQPEAQIALGNVCRLGLEPGAAQRLW